MPRTIAIANQKGGVGKTTTTINLGAALAEQDKSILLVDLDPQSSLSIALGIDVYHLPSTIYDVLLETKPDLALADTIAPTKIAQLEVVPANIDLSKAELELMSEMNRERALASALARLDRDYDYILIDCPPSLGLLTTNALAAANEVLIPIQSDYLALRGASVLINNTIPKVQKKLNSQLRICGILITMYDRRTTHAKEIVEEIRSAFGDLVFQSIINLSVRVKEAPIEGSSILAYDSKSPVSQAYRTLAQEIINNVPEKIEC